MNTEKIEKLKKSLSNSKIPADLKPKIEAEIKRLEDLDAKQSEPKEEEKEVKPVAKKTTTRKPRTTKTVAKKTSTAKPSQTSKPKRTAMSVAKEIRKDGESWKDAMARASKVMKEKSKTATKDVETELQKLTKLVRGEKNKEKVSRVSDTNLKRDASRKAKPLGARKVTRSGETSNQYGTYKNHLGRKYVENRDKHGDRLAPRYPKNAPLLAKGGSVDNSIIDELWRGYASAILFTETDMDSGEPLDSEFSIYDFNKESEANSKKMLSQYYSKYKDAIEESELDLETVGMDIWYTQSGQGAGFFDHSLDQEVEDKLTKGAEEFGKFPSTETYRGKVIIRGGKSYAEGGYLTDPNFGNFQNTMFAKGGEIEFQHSNIRIVGTDMDSNGNRVVKVSFPNQRAFSIQTNGDLPKTHNLLKGYNKNTNFSDKEIESMEDEIIDYVKNYGSANQKKSLRISKNYLNKNSYAKGGGIRRKNGQTYDYGRVWTKDHNEFDKGADHEVNYRRKKLAKGGAIKNQYAGRTPEDIWNNLTIEQRQHFLIDHFIESEYEEQLRYKDLNEDDKELVDEYRNKEWKKLSGDVRQAFREHVKLGQYAKGGGVGTHKYTLSEAKNMLGAEKSKNEGFSWFVSDVDYYGEDDNEQEYGVHLTDKELLDLADEVGDNYAKGGGIRRKNGQTYDYGRVWTKDHNEFDKGADHEVNYRRKRLAKGGRVESLTKELYRLQRELNSSRLQTYRLGDNSQEAKDRKKEREVKLARFNEVLKELRESDAKFELGGVMATDLAGHTGGGDGGLNAGMPLDGFSNTSYTGLVGETGAMSSGEMFMNGGSVNSKFDLSGYKKFRTFNDLEEAKEYVDMDRKKYSRAKESVVIKEGNKFQVWVIPASGIETGNRVYEAGGGLPSGVSQPYMITESFGNPAQHFAKGGGVRRKNGQTYDYGRVWTKDHNEFDKGADHEVNYRRKGKFLGVFAKGGGVKGDKYDGKTEKIVEELKNLKGGLDNKAPYVYQRDGYIYVSAEEGDNYADYDNYLYIDEKLEDFADKYDTYWDWENAGAIILVPLSDGYAKGGEVADNVQYMKDMMVSLYTYGGIERGSYGFNRYLLKYEDILGKKLFDKTYNKELKRLEGYEIEQNTSTDSEGLTYNSLKRKMDKGGGVNDESPKIYVADLEAYNNGRLSGVWLDLADYNDADELMEAIQDFLKTSGGEEYAIHDVEYVPRSLYSEYMSKNDFEALYEVMETAKRYDLPLEVVEEIVSQYGEGGVDEFYGKYDDAEDFAMQLVDDLGGLENFSSPEYYIYITNTDRRLISQEEADTYVDDIKYEDGGNRLIEEADMDVEEYEEANSEMQEEMLDKAREIVYDRIYDRWYDSLDDPYSYLVEELGYYEAEDFFKASFINVDYEKLGRDLDQDYTFIYDGGSLYVFNIR